MSFSVDVVQIIFSSVKVFPLHYVYLLFHLLHVLVLREGCWF